jgi:1-acyl-sn-glycerol-3-phosphate acyltransferase
VKLTSPLIRRGVFAPVILAVEFALIVFAPALAVASALLSLLFGGRRPLRLLALILTWAITHIAGVGAMLLLARSGAYTHYGVMRWFVGTISRAALRIARVRVEVRDSAAAEAVLDARETPVVALSIHSGEGDSLLVLDMLLRRHRRNPRIVMHQALALDPLIDMLGNRLPNRFIDPRGGDIEAEIASMSRGLGPKDAVLIFPEGGNFSTERRLRSIQRLLRRGHVEQAVQAERMTNLAAPRPGGALAALDSAPDADIVFFAHHGFPDGFGQVWRELPERTPILVQMWHVPAGEIPAGTEARIAWLFAWWETLDAWVGEQGVAQASSMATRRATAAGRVR